jgi:hypothetical protein
LFKQRVIIRASDRILAQRAADTSRTSANVRFTPKSGHWNLALRSAQQVRQHSSWRHEESQVESAEHQDNANIDYQSFPESVSEEREIYTDYNGCHRHHVKHYSYPSVHFTTSFHFRGYR